MSDGKAIAQAGHAYVESLLDALTTAPSAARLYCHLHPGTKISLDGGDAARLERLHDRLREAGIPCCLVIDRDHIEPPDFDGSDVLTALGVGPITRKQSRRYLSGFSLWPGKGGES